MKVRVRFAPSPTGYLHVGGARTALYNFLFARKHKGTFILRIEDTDRQRFVEDSVEDIMEGLKWLGILWDEGPYFQSQRLDIYREYAHKLVERGYGYYCFCSEERLQALREMQKKLNLPTGYDRKCRDLPLDEVKKLISERNSYVIRLRVPLSGETVFHDLLRGEIRYDNRELEDIILLKSDGYPTYHLANVVDDHLMEITHVLRADEWIPSTPYHKILYDSFGWEPPVFAHLPVILSPEGKGKLSKRHGATSVREFREMGYLREALVNYLALLGWSPGEDREIVSLEEMIDLFDLNKVGKRGAVFDYTKLNWMNGEYIRKKQDEELFELILPFAQKKQLLENEEDHNKLRKIIPLIKERIKTLNDINEFSYFFREPENYDSEGLEKYFQNPHDFSYLEDLYHSFRKLETFDKFTTEKTLRELAEIKNTKPKEYIHRLRLSTTGKTYGPGIFDVLEILGKDETLERIRKFLRLFKK